MNERWIRVSAFSYVDVWVAIIYVYLGTLGTGWVLKNSRRGRDTSEKAHLL